MKQTLFLFFLIIQNFNITLFSSKPTQKDVEIFLKCRSLLSFIDRLEQHKFAKPQDYQSLPEYQKLQEEKNKLNCTGQEYEEFLKFLKLENETIALKMKLDQDLINLYRRANMSYSDFKELNKKAFMSIAEIAIAARNA
ncbi:hypothetical protein KBB68_02940 [Candidatus Babeliales bacterium]|nr:hypothetical protein [Candidatus Babeliales bacterium]